MGTLSVSDLYRVVDKAMSGAWAVARALIVVLLFILSIVCVLCTTYLPYSVSDYNISFSMALPNVAVVSAALFALVRWGGRVKRLSDIKMAHVVAFFGFALSVAWFFIADADPAWDSFELMGAARAILGSTDPGDVGEWATNGYIDHFPFQIPLVYILVFCLKIAGDRASIFFGLLNCVANAATLYLIVRITEVSFRSRMATFVSAVLSMSFGGLFLYSTFIYGNLICLPFMLFGFYVIARLGTAEKGCCRHPWAWLMLACGSMAMSAVIKSTMQIALIAFAIAVLCLSVRRRWPALIVCCILPFILSSCITNASISSAERWAGHSLTKNQVPQLSWIVMGIGGGKELSAIKTGDSSIADSLVRPGHYDGYVWEDPEANGYASRDEMNSAMISLRIDHFKKDPILMLRFFVRKFVFQWTEPSYEGYLASNWESEADVWVLPDKTRANRDSYTVWARSFYYGKAHLVTLAIMDINQTLIAIGALIAVAFSRRLRGRSLLPELSGLAIFALGGALLYLVWEMKCQYIFPFYLALIPFAAYGWSVAAVRISSILGLPQSRAARNDPYFGDGYEKRGGAGETVPAGQPCRKVGGQQS